MNDAATVREFARPLTGAPNDYDDLMLLVGDARFVLLGEASHGTHDFYFERAEITKRLIAEKGFTVLAIEADWPDAYRVHRYIGGSTDDPDANAALVGFRRFPTWMWRNTLVVEFVEWLRDFNATLDRKKTSAGFYGMDLYSLHSSIDAVLTYLSKVDPDAAARARRRYSSFEHFSQEPQEYGYAATAGMIESCEGKVVAQLSERSSQNVDVLRKSRLERAIGVIYRPESERLSHYFNAELPEQFDAVIHFDQTRAVQPLEQTNIWGRGELPETYPFNVWLWTRCAS